MKREKVVYDIWVYLKLPTQPDHAPVAMSEVWQKYARSMFLVQTKVKGRTSHIKHYHTFSLIYMHFHPVDQYIHDDISNYTNNTTCINHHTWSPNLKLYKYKLFHIKCSLLEISLYTSLWNAYILYIHSGYQLPSLWHKCGYIIHHQCTTNWKKKECYSKAIIR